MGDFLKTENSSKSLAWFIWLVIMIVGNMIFMNFIIAVVNESYENCMSKMSAQKFKVKVDMIVERESIMSEYDIVNTDWFPKFIVIRRKANGSQESEQWQGFVKEIVPKNFAVKEAVFPFNKFPGVDPILGPEMKSTGEVMGVGRTFAEAFAKSQLGAGERLKTGGTVFISPFFIEFSFYQFFTIY